MGNVKCNLGNITPAARLLKRLWFHGFTNKRILRTGATRTYVPDVEPHVSICLGMVAVNRELRGVFGVDVEGPVSGGIVGDLDLAVVFAIRVQLQDLVAVMALVEFDTHLHEVLRFSKGGHERRSVPLAIASVVLARPASGTYRAPVRGSLGKATRYATAKASVRVVTPFVHSFNRCPRAHIDKGCRTGTAWCTPNTHPKTAGGVRGQLI